jgi:hypothetical protein
VNGDACEKATMTDMIDALLIRQAVEAWVLCRDQGDWEGLRAVWHRDGVMVATWFQGPASEFIEASRQGWERGAVVHHFLGGSRTSVNGDRAIAQTKVTLSARAAINNVLCDITCTGRFFDRFTKDGDRWLLAQRQVIYEKDRADPVRSGDRVELDPNLLNHFPEGYRHLAYVQVKAGQAVLENLPGLRGEAVEALYLDGDHWLRTGEDSNFVNKAYAIYQLQTFHQERAQ